MRRFTLTPSPSTLARERGAVGFRSIVLFPPTTRLPRSQRQVGAGSEVRAISLRSGFCHPSPALQGRVLWRGKALLGPTPDPSSSGGVATLTPSPSPQRVSGEQG